MNKENLSPSKYNDVLNEHDLYTITNVKEGARNKFMRRKKVLQEAGIHFWTIDDAVIITTWHHVHQAGQKALEQTSIENKPQRMKLENVN